MDAVTALDESHALSRISDPRGHGVPTLQQRFYSTAFTIDSITFFASPNTIIVFGM
jgi:hypothetical protein